LLDRLSSVELTEIAGRIGWFELSEADLEEYRVLLDAVLATIDLVTDAPLPALPDASDRAAVQRSAGQRASRAEDPLNAVVRWIDVKAPDASGLLDGLRIAVKDSIAITGVPMTLGSGVLRDYEPARDSVVTERLLEHGANLVAVTNMDSFAFSGGGLSSAYGPTLNPFDLTRSAGGSSSGSGAVLAYADLIDGAIGTDQGGSVRVPASWNGVLGLKPTHGLVPYTGIVGIDATFDHVGPMATTVNVLGRLLLSMVGPDERDPRQAGYSYDSRQLEDVLASSASDLTNLRVGLVREGFSTDDELRSATSSAIQKVADRLTEAGASVTEVSVPEHLLGGGIAFAGFVEGMSATALSGGNGHHWLGQYDPELASALGEGLRTRGNELPPQMKMVALLGEHLRSRYSGSVYAAAQNQRPALRAGYDRALAEFDLLLMPTTPFPAFEVDEGLGLADWTLRGWEPLGNCAPLNMTGHPAISLPAATVDGLPVGAMLIARHFDDARLIDVAARYERRFGWASPLPDPR
jgi:amidase